MQKVTGLDEMFLAYDTPTTTGNMGAFSILQEVADDPSAGKADYMRAKIASRLDYLPLFRWRLQPMPVLGTRYWMEVDRVDLDYHVRTVRLPSPGTDEQLADEVSRLVAVPLDRRYPMWMLYVIEGVEGGRFAHLLKLSHGCADGTAQARVFDILCDEPTQELVYDPAPKVAEPLGGAPELVARQLLDAATTPVRAGKLVVDLGAWLVGQVRQDGVAALPAALGRALPGEFGRPLAKVANILNTPTSEKTSVAPGIPTLMPVRSMFNRQLTSKFHFEFADLPLDDFRRAGKAVGGTINDAVLAVTAGAYRAYLAEHGGVPDRPLISSSPVSFRQGDEKEPWANHVYALFIPIPTHLADPVERLHYAHHHATKAKENWQNGPGHLTREMMDLVPGQPLAVGMQLIARLPDGSPGLPFNCAISNIKGSTVTQHFGGAEMLGYWPVPFLMPGVATMIVMQSYKDRLNLGIAACPDVVPDLGSFPTLLERSLADLLTAEELLAHPAAAHPQPTPIRARARRAAGA